MKNWEDEIVLPEKDSDIEYAYILEKEEKIIRCDRDTLLIVIKNNRNVKFVATPENPTFIIPGSDFFTIQPLLKARMGWIRFTFIFLGICALLFGGLTLMTGLISGNGFHFNTSAKFIFIVFWVLPILSGTYELLAIRRINENNFRKESAEIKFNFWINQKHVISIFIVTGILVLITILQFITGLQYSVESAGLVKPRTLDGEYWRLLTCTMLHASVMHIFFNGLAIYIIGRMVIRITGFSYFAIVFLFSGLLGSVFSLYFLPTQTSVGASGGIMGLIGFLLILSIKFKDHIPRNIIKSMVIVIILVAVMGLSVSEMIDNAAHGGGLLGGILIGLILIRRHKNMIPYQASLFVKILGSISVLVLIGGIVMIIKQL